MNTYYLNKTVMAFLFVALFVLGIFLPGTSQGGSQWNIEYDRVVIAEVTDGDTLETFIEVWPDTFIRTEIRLAGINTPEKRFAMKACLEKHSKPQCQQMSVCEKAEAAKASAFAKQFVSGRACQVSGINPSATKYKGRMNGDIICGNETLSNALLNAGLARPYHGQARNHWCLPF